MSLLPSSSSSQCDDTPQRVSDTNPDGDGVTPEKVNQPTEADIEHTQQPSPVDIGPLPDDIEFGFGPHINNHVVPMVDVDLQPVTNTTTFDHQLHQDGLFFTLGAWLFAALGQRKSHCPNWTDTTIFKELSAEILSQRGKRTRHSWLVDKQGNPLGSTIEVSLRGVQLTVARSKKVIAIKYSNESLEHVLKICWDELQKRGSKEHLESCMHDSTATPQSGKTAYASALSADELAHLKELNVKWHPSKKQFVLPSDKKLTLKPPSDQHK
eukprot:12333818-Karenia_brevis.AAC.2